MSQLYGEVRPCKDGLQIFCRARVLVADCHLSDGHSQPAIPGAAGILLTASLAQPAASPARRGARGGRLRAADSGALDGNTCTRWRTTGGIALRVVRALSGGGLPQLLDAAGKPCGLQRRPIDSVRLDATSLEYQLLQHFDQTRSSIDRLDAAGFTAGLQLESKIERSKDRVYTGWRIARISIMVFP